VLELYLTFIQIKMYCNFNTERDKTAFLAASYPYRQFCKHLAISIKICCKQYRKNKFKAMATEGKEPQISHILSNHFTGHDLDIEIKQV
jgi:hypothetical protein